MKSNNLNVIKNLMWSLCIGICLLSVGVGLIFAMFHKYTGDAPSVSAGMAAPVSANSAEQSRGNQRGTLRILERTKDAGEGYINGLTFLMDSTFMSLRDLSLVNQDTVWCTETGSMPMATLDTTLIRYRDGSAISPSAAAMTSKPSVLVIGIGTDGLANVDEDTFVANYDRLINNILASSPNTTIVCCGLPSIVAGYSGNDHLTVTRISDGNDWVKLVCRDTGAYFLDVQEELSESVQLLSRFAASNGKTLNRAGLESFLTYVRTHAVP